MLTDESYQMAWMVYIGAGIAALVYFYFLLGPRLSAALRLGIVLILAALVLTPAHPAEDIATWAPAIFVSGFELLTNGPEAAARPFRSLLAAQGIAVALCLLIWVVQRLRRKPATSSS